MDISEQPKILIVDDKEENLVATRKLLAECEAQILTAKSGKEAIHLVLRHKFALILLDVQMPLMNGFDTAALIQSDASHKNVPIIFVTASLDNDHLLTNGYQSGAVDYLYKPLRKDILLAKVSVFLKLETQKKQLEKLALELKGLNEHNSLLIESTSEGIIGFDLHGIIVMANTSARSLIGNDATHLIGSSVFDLFGGSKLKQCINNWTKMTTKKGIFHEQSILRRSNFSELPVEFNASPMIDKEGVFKGAVLTFQDITERLKLEEHLHKLAKYDTLTGLANRTLFEEHITTLFNDHDKNQLIALIFIDLDDFKTVNDTFGHNAGDTVLKEIAKRLRHSIRRNDLIVRLCGDEFVIVIDSLEKESDTNAIGQYLLKEIRRPMQVNKNQIIVNASIGIAITRTSEMNSKELLKAADAAMYQIKKNGKNGATFF